jgi:hypothetical protein
LPKSLDETYERLLREINESNREDVYRLLQCLVVSVRPLCVEELAEVLAVDMDGTDGIPRLNPDWRWEDQEELLQAACSSLVEIVDTGYSRLVQFSHFSVKEFLTSPRLASSSNDISCYHISLERAHMVLAQSCVGVLLRSPVDDHVYVKSIKGQDHTEDQDSVEDQDNIEDSFPLAAYAARHWVDHALFENVLSHIWRGVELLFDPNKPHFSRWLRLHNIDREPDFDAILYQFTARSPMVSNIAPLYCAALCGLQDLTEHLIVNHLQDVNIHRGYYQTPLVAALGRKHFQMAELLYQQGATLDIRSSRGGMGWTS